MKVAVDMSPLTSGHQHRGMGVYTRNLVKFLEKSKKVEIVERGEDILHIPYFDLFFSTLDVRRDVPTVVTVPDVIPLIYPKNYPPGLRGSFNLWRQKRELGKAAAVITISETSKKDIVRFLGIPSEKIFVTYLAPGQTLRREGRGLKKKQLKLPKKYVLYVGDVNYNKNIIRLVRACKKAGVPLVIVGKQAVEENYDKNHIENASLVELHRKYGNDADVVRLGYLTDEELAFVWGRASVYCQPSLYEGFGLPVLEAQQFGVPVVASRTQALVEVGGHGALFFDPYDVSDIASSLKRVIENKKLRRELIDKGKKNVKKFSWERTAEETIEVYKSLL